MASPNLKKHKNKLEEKTVIYMNKVQQIFIETHISGLSSY